MYLYNKSHLSVVHGYIFFFDNSISLWSDQINLRFNFHFFCFCFCYFATCCLNHFVPFEISPESDELTIHLRRIKLQIKQKINKYILNSDYYSSCKKVSIVSLGERACLLWCRIFFYYLIRIFLVVWFLHCRSNFYWRHFSFTLGVGETILLRTLGAFRYRLVTSGFIFFPHWWYSTGSSSAV